MLVFRGLIEWLLGLRVDIVRVALKNGDVPLRDDSGEGSLEELSWCVEEV